MSMFMPLEELPWLVLQGELESIAKDMQIVVRLLTACVGHPAIVHIQNEIDAMLVGIFLVEVAGVEL
eukprot:5025858-Pleurochrysis_carterae.AAC.2